MAQGIIRSITPPPVAYPYLANVVVTDVVPADVVKLRTMSADRRTVYGVNGGKLRQSTNNGTTWTDVIDFNATGVFTGAVRAFTILPNGEALVGNAIGGGSTDNSLYYSTGFATNPATATWARCQDGTNNLTLSRGNSVIHEAWGISAAPKGHPREGLVVITEYCLQAAAGDPVTMSPKIWLSFDYGKTFKVIGDLFSLLGGKQFRQHMHGILYDPYSDAIFASFGDGWGTVENDPAGSNNGVVMGTGFATGANVTWTYVWGPRSTADKQATTMVATPTGILFAGDGYPPGIARLPRRGYRKFGDMQMVLNYGGGTDTNFIGQQMYQAAPGMPILCARQYTKNGVGYAPILDCTFNGVDFFELYHDTSTSPEFPYLNAIGPTADGKIIMQVEGDKRTANNRSQIVGDLVVP